MNSTHIQYAEYFQQPNDYNDYDDDIENRLDRGSHRNKSVDQIQSYTNSDQNKYELN